MRVRRYRVWLEDDEVVVSLAPGQGLSRRSQRCERALPHRGVQPAGGEVDGEQADDLGRAGEGGRPARPGPARTRRPPRRDRPARSGRARPEAPAATGSSIRCAATSRSSATARSRAGRSSAANRIRTKPDAGSVNVRPSHEPTPTIRGPAASATTRAPTAPSGTASITVSPSSAASAARCGPARSASGGSTPRASAAMLGPTVQPPPSRRAAPTSASVASTRVTVARGSPVSRATPATDAPGCSARHSSTWNARRIDSLRPAPAKERNSSAKGADSNLTRREAPAGAV